MALQNYIPNEHKKNIYEIDLEKLQKQGLKGLIVDLDNTLISWDKPYATDQLKQWLEQVSNNQLKIIIASNNNAERIGIFANPINLPYIPRAKKPLASGFKRALAQLNLTSSETVMVGDQIMTDIYGGNKMGLYTILVDPIVKTDGFWTKFNRMRERRILKKLKKQGLMWGDN